MAAYDKTALYAEALLNAVEREMPEVTAFTRDDCMYLSPFQGVATITRYQYVGRAIRYLLDANKIIEIEFRKFILTGTKRRYAASLSAPQEYEVSIRGMIANSGARTVDVSMLLSLWVTDQHLSISTKRTILRETLKRLARQGWIEDNGVGVYTMKGVK